MSPPADPIAGPRRHTNRIDALRAAVATLRHAISADHADDPTWTIAQIATLAQAHRSDSEMADAHTPPGAYDNTPDFDAVALARQREIATLRAERDEAVANAGEVTAIASLLSDREEIGTYAKVEAIIEQLAAQTEGLAQVEQEMRTLSDTPIGWKSSKIDTMLDAWADTLAALRTPEAKPDDR